MKSGKQLEDSKALHSLRKREGVVVAVLAVAIGILASYAAIAFRSIASLIQISGFGDDTEFLASLAGKLPWWQILLVPTAGGLLIGLFVYVCLPGRRNQTVADVVVAASLHGGRLSLKTGVFAAISAAASIGCGASVGREGPVVHIGATLASCLGRFLRSSIRLDRSAIRTLLGCGAAAAVAASFNAPIAGAFFALEVIVDHYRLTAFAPVVVSSVLGTAISRAHFGDFPAFTIAHTEIASYFELPIFAMLEVVSALVAVFFMASIMFATAMFANSPLPRWSRPAFGGLAVGAIALVYPQVLGVGYEAADQALHESLAFEILVALMVAKTAATALSLGSGFGGGVFSPSLVVGAMAGSAFGMIMEYVLPGYTTAQSAYAIIGMGAVAGAVLGAPISTILTVFELTTSYGMTIAVMIATAISSLVAHRLIGKSFFIWQLHSWGIYIDRDRGIHLLRLTLLHEFLNHDPVLVRHDTSLASVREQMLRHSHDAAFVVDEGDRLFGTLTLADIQEIDNLKLPWKILRTIARTDIDVLTINDCLEDAIDVLETLGVSTLPIVENEQSMRVVGTVHQRDITTARNRLMIQARGTVRRGSI